MKNSDNIEKMSSQEMVIYRSPDGDVKVDVLFNDETVWLTQAQIGELFGKAKLTVSEHIKNIFDEGELEKNSVVRNFRTTAGDGTNRIRISGLCRTTSRATADNDDERLGGTFGQNLDNERRTIAYGFR